MIPNKKSSILNDLLKLMRDSRLNDFQKLEIVNLIEQETTATEIQKDRFKLFYGLNKDGKKDMKFTQIARMYGCTAPAIRSSVFAMKCKLLKYEKEFSIIENIVNECKM